MHSSGESNNEAGVGRDDIRTKRREKKDTERLACRNARMVPCNPYKYENKEGGREGEVKKEKEEGKEK